MTSAPTETAAVEQAGIASRFRPYPTAPMPALHCLIEDQPLVSVDWSLGGLQAEPYAGTLRPGADFSISAIGPGAGALSCASHATRVRLMPVGIRARGCGSRKACSPRYLSNSTPALSMCSKR